jgi:hypothetical protein
MYVVSDMVREAKRGRLAITLVVVGGETYAVVIAYDRSVKRFEGTSVFEVELEKPEEILELIDRIAVQGLRVDAVVLE